MRRHLFIVASVVLTSNLALAGSNGSPTASSLVDARLIQPLAAKDRNQSRFSRAMLPPSERRVRVLDEKPQHDSSGEAFVTFEVDARTGWGESSEAKWRKATISGCVYPGRGEVFIKRGNAFHPATAALGKKTKPAPDVICHPAA